MLSILKKVWPVMAVLAMFITLSALMQNHLTVFSALLTQNSSGLAMTFYVLLGIAMIVIPFGSILPFMPIAVALWGWKLAAALTLLSWVIGGQLLFEFSRAVGKPFLSKFIPKTRLDTIEKLVQDKGLLHAIFVRMIVHEDLVSYAFGLFTNVSSWEFFLITAIGTAPGAILYAYFGGLPFAYQVAFASLGVIALTLYWTIELKYPSSWWGVSKKQKNAV